MKARNYAYAAVGLILFAGAVYAAQSAWLYYEKQVPFPVDTQEGKAQAVALLKRHGAPFAYEIFKAQASKLDSLEQHNAAHLFGEALYTHSGLEGMTVCDASFGFGCFHSFIASAIGEHGIDIVTRLDHDCVARYGVLGLGCSHGIGHGVLSYFGYNLTDLIQALATCEKLSWKHPYGGCQEGAFMEYNFRSMENDADRRVRSFTLEDTFEPCASLPERFRTACFFSQPDWWWHALAENAALLPELGGACAKAGNDKWIMACFRGIGYVQATAREYDVEHSVEACDAAGKLSYERLWCREGAAWAFYAFPAHRDAAPRICFAGLSDAQSTQCLEEYLFYTQ